MTLLIDLQNAAVDASEDLGTLLRKCKVLAARLDNQPLENWLIWESNGYPEDVPVPDYRQWPLEVKGHFSGYAGSGLRDAPIPSICLPEHVRGSYENYSCRLSISSIEATLRESDGRPLRVPTGDLAVALGTNVYEGNNCLQAWAEFSPNNLHELVNAVRNKVLDFSLALWKRFPDLGELDAKTSEAEAKAINQIFNTTVYGGSANLVGNASNSTFNLNFSAGDFAGLRQFLLEHGVSEEDAQMLEKAIDQEEEPVTDAGFGPHISDWISRMVAKAASGSWNISVGAAGGLLAQALGKFFGL
ncbi:hypothetical protein FH712_07375 [Marinobacter nauticus]|uniref:AbiTii domain-containing protein n=1 Tax=Marinobacter nauticus TaxID=2743 RepID=UPI00112F96F2|nr:hypothetical protein [Marinobacter nauticus]TPW23749.1 hypothetical protein FH712_07375 [Marinobacter nauticus]